MNLHLTATSERGKPVTKSGNEYLEVFIIDDNREPLMTIRMEICKDNLGNKIRTYVNFADHLYASVWGERIEVGKHKCTFNSCQNIACRESENDICKKHFERGIND